MRAQAQKGAVTRTCEFSGPRAGLSPLSTTQSQAEPWCPLDLADVLHVKLICDLYEFMCVFFCQLFSLMFLAFSAWNRKTKGFLDHLDQRLAAPESPHDVAQATDLRNKCRKGKRWCLAYKGGQEAALAAVFAYSGHEVNHFSQEQTGL